MSLMFDGSERDTIIINKNVYKFDHVWPLNMDGANAQNAKYRGSSLGAFTEDYATNIHNGDFDSMQVGDTFTQNGHTYKIAGFNYLCGAKKNPNLGNHLIMITDSLGEYAMNPSDTTAGGFAGSNMWKSTFPNFVKQFKADFGNHLLTWNEFLTTGINGNAVNNAANIGEYFAVQASMMNGKMYWGSRFDYNKLDTGIETKQLPIMKLHPAEKNTGPAWLWLRDIVDNQIFLSAEEKNGYLNYSQTATETFNTRAFFLID